MATLTVLHQGHTQGIYELSNGMFTLGRDPDNAIQLSDEAVAPLHAVLHMAAGQALLRQADGLFPVLLNGRAVREHRLQDGDRIGIGQHVLFFVEDKQAEKPAAPPPITQAPRTLGSVKIRDALDTLPFNRLTPMQEGEAGLQFMSGEYIGRILSLRNAMTQLGKLDQDGAALLARRSDGYYLTAIDQENQVKLNGVAIGSRTVKLTAGDRLEIGKQILQFFWEVSP